MSYGDDSDSSLNKSFSQEKTRPALRQPRMYPPASTLSEERSETPHLQKSVLQKRSSLGQAAALFASPSKAEKAFKAQNTIKFMLRPDAPDFVPKGITVTATPPSIKTHSVQDRLKKHNLSDKYNSPKQNHNETTDISLDTVEITDAIQSIVETLETFVINLIRDPGLYNNILDTFMSFLTPYLTNPQDNIMIISDTASMLFIHSVDNPNFRYNGARLCITISECSPEFQANLLLLCEKDINYNSKNLKGLLLFIAELYVNKIDNSKMYGNMLLPGFEVMLSQQNEDSVIAACQVIKLTGSKLSIELPGNLEDVLNSLENLKHSMRNNIQTLIDSVKSNCQVQIEDTSNGDEPKSIPGMEATNTIPIFIGKDGEEISFDDDNYSGDDDSDMEEMYLQYEEFLKL